MPNYPGHWQPFPVYWRVRDGATVDDPPLPVKSATQARVRAIRQMFLRDFRGVARVDDLGAACEDAGILDELNTPRSMREAVLDALRPIATCDSWAASGRPAQVTGQAAHG